MLYDSRGCCGFTAYAQCPKNFLRLRPLENPGAPADQKILSSKLDKGRIGCFPVLD